MPTPRETILTALHARLSALPVTALRGEVLPECVPGSGLLILGDGEPEDLDMILSPWWAYYRHRVEIEAFMPLGMAEAVLDTLLVLVGTARLVVRQIKLPKAARSRRGRRARGWQLARIDRDELGERAAVD